MTPISPRELSAERLALIAKNAKVVSLGHATELLAHIAHLEQRLFIEKEKYAIAFRALSAAEQERDRLREALELISKMAKQIHGDFVCIPQEPAK